MFIIDQTNIILNMAENNIINNSTKQIESHILDTNNLEPNKNLSEPNKNLPEPNKNLPEPNKNLQKNQTSNKNSQEKQISNIFLLIFDLLFLPIVIIRMILIYFWGSKYNLKGFQFLDVIMHADKPYFNQDDCRLINTIGKDYRVVIRDDSRIFPLDITKYINVE